MKYEIGYLSDVGILKKVNEDSLLIKYGVYKDGLKDEEFVFTVICDGMGGLEQGELASSNLIEFFERWYENDFSIEMSMKEIEFIWKEMLENVNEVFLEYAKKNKISFGTTITGLLIKNDEYLCVNIGDCRLYCIRDDIYQITEDDTYVEQEIKAKRMTKEEGKLSDKKHILTQCIGASKIINPKFYYGKVERGYYLICTDGFRNELNDEELYKFIEMNESEEFNNTLNNRLKKIATVLKSKYEKDNISSILIKVL